MKNFGATGVNPEAGEASGVRGNRQRVARHSWRRFHGAVVHLVKPHLRDGRRQPQADWPQGFTIDAKAMAAVLFDFATNEDYRESVQREFDGIKALFGEYQAALKKTYTVPNVPDPK